jgi:hypothetical protein
MSEDVDHVQKIVDLLRAAREREIEARAEFHREHGKRPLAADEDPETRVCGRCGMVEDDPVYFGCWLCGGEAR